MREAVIQIRDSPILRNTTNAYQVFPRNFIVYFRRVQDGHLYLDVNVDDGQDLPFLGLVESPDVGRSVPRLLDYLSLIHEAFRVRVVNSVGTGILIHGSEREVDVV